MYKQKLCFYIQRFCFENTQRKTAFYCGKNRIFSLYSCRFALAAKIIFRLKTRQRLPEFLITDHLENQH